MAETKKATKSKTLIGAIVAAVGTGLLAAEAGGLLPVGVSSAINETGVLVASFAGSLLAIFGRFNKKIKPII